MLGNCHKVIKFKKLVEKGKRLNSPECGADRPESTWMDSPWRTRGASSYY